MIETPISTYFSCPHISAALVALRSYANARNVYVEMDLEPIEIPLNVSEQGVALLIKQLTHTAIRSSLVVSARERWVSLRIYQHGESVCVECACAGKPLEDNMDLYYSASACDGRVFTKIDDDSYRSWFESQKRLYVLINPPPNQDKLTPLLAECTSIPYKLRVYPTIQDCPIEVIIACHGIFVYADTKEDTAKIYQIHPTNYNWPLVLLVGDQSLSIDGYSLWAKHCLTPNFTAKDLSFAIERCEDALRQNLQGLLQVDSNVTVKELV